MANGYRPSGTGIGDPVVFAIVSLTKRVLIALGAGLLIGTGVSAASDPRLLSAVSFVQPIGTLWVNAIRMTVVPLVFRCS